jgi:putative NADPH-quinone reductase
MNVLVVIGHQSPGSFNHAIAEAAVEELKACGHEVVYHDLYQEAFDPVMTSAEIPKNAPLSPLIQQHCRELRAADGYIIVHPNWWAMPPAVLKGWIDRVFRQGVAYEFGPGGVVAHLEGKTALVFTTSNTPRDLELSLYGDPLENLWKNCIFGLCGVRRFHRCNFEPIVVSTPEQRKEWLAESRRLVCEYFPPRP